ncbi:YcxB family protein [Streptomyces sp. NPDC050400]|uniref:YcxB family protein n=1 Tax=Streptomyces sp. NPDC050400 TaxID=3365610 RepID=UPI0037BC15CA
MQGQGGETRAGAGEAGEAGEHVELEYLPTRADVRAGIGVREHLRRIHLVRWGLVGFFLLLALLAVVDSFSLFSLLIALFCAAVIWAIPTLQARQVHSLVGWQGTYRTTVGEAGVTDVTAHTRLLQRWSVFRGYRETHGHFVLVGGDPGMQILVVLPKRATQEPGGAVTTDALRALLDRHSRRV